MRSTALRFLTRAGPEIGVASTKAFTTQLAALLLLAMALARQRGRLAPEREAGLMAALRTLPLAVEGALAAEAAVTDWSAQFALRRHALFLGRGIHYPIAMEGALKLKEISYIHAEAYPAGELKHGPLALVDSAMPVVAIAPGDALLEKLKSNLQEVRARGGELYVLADEGAPVEPAANDARGEAARARAHRLADRAHDPAAAPRLPRGPVPRHRRRQAAQPREVGDRRVGESRGIRPPLPSVAGASGP